MLRQWVRVWPVLFASLCPDAESLERSWFQRGGSCWALRTTPCVLHGQQGRFLTPHLSRVAIWPEPSPSSANPIKSEGKWALVHFCFCEMKVALCNNITSCHAPAEDMSPLDAFWYLARTPEGTIQGQRANSVQLSQGVHISGSLAKSWPLQHQLLIHSPSYQQYPPLFLWGQSLGHSSPMRRTEIMLGWMSSSWQTEGTFCSYCWFNTSGFGGVLFCFVVVFFLVRCSL